MRRGMDEMFYTGSDEFRKAAEALAPYLRDIGENYTK